ncbi:MAG: hypothetical protein ACRDJO_08460 [Actinomycetota bacterium]
MRTRGASNGNRTVAHRRKEAPPLRIKPVKQTCAAPACNEVARFVVAVSGVGDGGFRAARRCCGEHLEEAVFWAEGIVASDPRARGALISRWGPWALTLHEVPA